MHYRIDAAAKLLARIGAGLVKKKIQVKGKDGNSFMRTYLVRSGLEPEPIPKRKSKPAVTRAGVIDAIRRSKQTGMPTSIGGDLMAYVMKGKKLTPQERREIRGNAGIRNAEEQKKYDIKVAEAIEANKNKPPTSDIWGALHFSKGMSESSNTPEPIVGWGLIDQSPGAFDDIFEGKGEGGNQPPDHINEIVNLAHALAKKQGEQGAVTVYDAMISMAIHADDVDRYLGKDDALAFERGHKQKQALQVIRDTEGLLLTGTGLSDALSLYVREFPHDKTLDPRVKEKMEKVAADAPHISPEESYSLCQYIGIDYESMNVSVRGDVKIRYTPKGNEVRITDPHGVNPTVSYMSKFSPSAGNLSDIAKATEDDPRQSYFAQSKAAVIALRKLPPLSEGGVKKAYADSELHDRVRDVPEEFFSRPREEQLLRRGLGVPEESLPAFIASHRPGKIVKDKGFASASLAVLPKWVERNSTVEYRIDWKRDGKTQGKFVDHYKRTNIEHEVLFPPMVKFLVTAPPKQDNGKWIIHLKEM